MNDFERDHLRNFINAAEAFLAQPYSTKLTAVLAANIQRAKMLTGDIRVPYGEFCHHPDKCEGKSNCPRDPVCSD